MTGFAKTMGSQLEAISAPETGSVGADGRSVARNWAQAIESTRGSLTMPLYFDAILDRDVALLNKLVVRLRTAGLVSKFIRGKVPRVIGGSAVREVDGITLFDDGFNISIENRQIVVRTQGQRSRVSEKVVADASAAVDLIREQLSVSR